MVDDGIKYALKAGTVLHGKKYAYRIDKVLGQGTFGITYQASVYLSGDFGTLDSSMVVAIKEFFMKEVNSRMGSSIHTGSDSLLFCDYLQKFRKEAVRLSKMNHPGIVKVLEDFDANNTSYYVMEYLPGGSLDDEIKREGSIDLSRVYVLMKGICDALTSMHKERVLHLDLKPGNIMIGKDDLPKLIDFGLAKHYDESGVPESSTSIGLGTPGYAPLEQSVYQQGSVFAPTLDVYALGATLYKMLTGKTPPPAALVLNRPKEISQTLVSAGVYEGMIQLVIRAMHPLRDARLQTVPEFWTQFQQAYAKDNIASEGKQSSELTVAAYFGASSDSNDDEGTEMDAVCANSGISGHVAESSMKSSVKVERVARPSFFARNKRSISLWVGLMLVAMLSPFLFYLSNGVSSQAKIPSDFVLIPGGTLYTDNGSDGVKVDSFYISKYETTLGQYTAVCATLMVGDDNQLPLSQVGLINMAMYCNELSKKEGYDGFYQIEKDEIKYNPLGNGYRLPTVEEWKYAAKGNQKYFKLPENIKQYAWFSENSGNSAYHPGQLYPNDYGIYDMFGNIAELAWNNSDDSYYSPVTMGGSYATSYRELGMTVGRDDLTDEGLRLVFVPRGLINNNVKTLRMIDYQARMAKEFDLKSEALSTDVPKSPRVAFAEKAILDRILMKKDIWSGIDLDDYLIHLLSKWERDSDELYETGNNIFNLGIWHIGSDSWDEKLTLQWEKECSRKLNGKSQKMYHLRFELYYGDEHAGYKEIIIYPTGSVDENELAFKVYDICADDANNGYWTREELKKYYQAELEREGMYKD